MSDYGLKISKDGEDISSTDPDDFIFDSSIQSLPLIERVEVQRTITSTDCQGTFDAYTHNLGFFTLALVYVTDKSFLNRQILPFSITSPGDKTCSGDRLFEDFDYRVKENKVEIDYDVQCIVPMMGGSCPPNDIDYTFEINLYMFELGS